VPQQHIIILPDLAKKNPETQTTPKIQDLVGKNPAVVTLPETY